MQLVSRLFALCVRGLLAVGLVLGSIGLGAQNIETIMAPGKIAKAHAHIENDCNQCHVRFDKHGQDKRCLECHKDVRADMQAHSGYHGKLPAQECRVCHAEHRGADAKLVVLDTHRFDHGTTSFLLMGRHQKLDCEKCHLAGKKLREAPSSCAACHRKDDKHKGGLGTDCASCHTEADWKLTHFDHDKTKFPLTGKHSAVACNDCHQNGVFKDTRQACVACHKKDDEQKGHKGLYGNKCDACHATQAWKQTSFNHDTDTKYPLRGRHHTVNCNACHSANPYKVHPSQECVACHKKDDKHQNSLGKDCASCHTERQWSSTRFDHDSTHFPLRMGHASPTVKCESCHKDLQSMRNTSMACISCHEKDDQHKTNLGRACGDCHTEQAWKFTNGRFDHAKTRFPMRNAHAAPTLTCQACHRDPAHFRATPLTCIACHQKDDKHQAQLGVDCARCHTDAQWKLERFDHNHARFVLTGQHSLVTCKSCHATQRFRDAAQECIGCHLKDDRHQGRLGSVCADCHNTRSWALWRFEHDEKTHFPLSGQHQHTACVACHVKAASPGHTIAPLASSCYACHKAHDPHDGQFGPRCDQCHTTANWKRPFGRP